MGNRNAAVHESAALDAGGDDAPRARRDVESVRDMERLRSIIGWFNNPRGAAAAPVTEEPTPPSELSDLPSQRSGLRPSPTGLGPLEVMQLSLETLQGAVSRFRLAGYPPDVLITIPRVAANALDFHRASEMIALGRERTGVALDRASRRS